MKRNIHLTTFGLIILKLVLFISIITLGPTVFDIENPAFYYCLVVLFAISIGWLIVYKKQLLSGQTQAIVQILLDSSIENILIHFSGGLESPFIMILILDLFLGAYLLPRNKMFIMACYISIFYAAFSTLAYLELLPSFLLVQDSIIPSPEVYFYYVVFMRVFIFFMMGYLASHLSGRIHFQQARIQEMQNLTDKILFQMGTGLISVNRKDEIIYSNKAASDILGYSNRQLQKQKWQRIFFQNDEILSPEFLPKAYSQDGAEVHVTRLDQTQVFLGVSISEFTDENNRIAGKTIIFRDLTMYKEMEKLRSEQKRMKTLGELSAVLAHEIKNPLASICGSLEVFKESTTFQNMKSKKLVDVILKESERLGRILSEFLTYSGGLPLRKNPHDIRELIEEILIVLENHAEIHEGITIRFKYNPDLDYRALVDEDYLKQMVFNLVINAVQAIEDDGSVTVSLKHIRKHGKNFIRVQVIDTGRGISAEHREQIFNPFFSTRPKGIGLGLNVCLKVAQKHGWEINFEPGEERGTVFYVLIPTLNDEVNRKADFEAASHTGDDWGSVPEDYLLRRNERR
jgi:two-component system sensor histidine kinase PilS (NtrC family)